MGELIYPMAIREYRPEWDGMWPAVREAIWQEFLDLFGDSWSIRREAGLVIVEGFGPIFELESLILGVSGKRGDESMRGTHGEGTKMGWMIFTREGIDFRFFSGDLVFHTEIIELHGKECMKVVWEEAKYLEGARYEIAYDGPMFENRVITEGDDRVLVEIVRGEGPTRKILSDPGLWVKNLWVQEGTLVEELAFGYDLVSPRLDLSRNMVEPWNARHEIGRIWSKVVDISLLTRFYKAVEQRRGEAHIYLAQPQGPALKAHQAAFAAVFGANAVVRTSDASAKEAEWRGGKAVDLPSAWRDRLKGIADTDAVYVADRTQKNVAFIEDRSLSPRGRRVIRWLRRRVVKLYPAISVVAASLKRDRGQAHGNMVLLSPSILDDPMQAAATCAHEISHIIDGVRDLDREQPNSIAKIAIRLYAEGLPK